MTDRSSIIYENCRCDQAGSRSRFAVAHRASGNWIEEDGSLLTRSTSPMPTRSKQACS